MRTVLICPGERPMVGFLAQSVPLVLVPTFGECLLYYWLESLAVSGCKDVLILATDRPEMVRQSVGDGSRWGLRVEVSAELKEHTPDEALAKLGSRAPLSGPPAGQAIALDHFPGVADAGMFGSYRQWYTAMLNWMPHLGRHGRLGLREIRPQVWCGLRANIAPTAALHPPCWLGDHVQVGANTIIGPNAILENRVVVDWGSEVQSSFVGPETMVGTLTHVKDSIAWGNTLIDWRSGSCTQVPDSFLLCSLSRPAQV